LDDSKSREGANITAAFAMLDTFASVGVGTFDVTLLDIEGREQGFQRNRSLEELRHSMARRLAAATATRHSVVIRPRSNAALLIQLDDFTPEKVAEIEPYAFLTLRTSPGNYQVWLAVSDAPKESEKEAAKQFRTRVRRGAGADHSATGATRIAGSLNFKTKYAPDFPVVEITRANPGSMTTVAALELAGLLAPREAGCNSCPRPLPHQYRTNLRDNAASRNLRCWSVGLISSESRVSCCRSQINDDGHGAHVLDCLRREPYLSDT
jgi:hypothetical protein